MRLALYSDLHLESSPWAPPHLDVDVVVLAGDISNHTRGLAWASSVFAQPVVYVAGNHEYYDAHLGLLAELQKPQWVHADVHFLERQTVVLAGVRFLGCTLWSGFDLYGREAVDVHMAAARRSINDYWMIRAREGRRLEPRDTRKLHSAALSWLDLELSKPFDGKTVVVTHFAPHPRCVAPQHEGSDVSPYFVSDLAWLMEKHQIDVWCYGHTHTNISFAAESGCRVISNQRGYPGERANGFEPNIVIAI